MDAETFAKIKYGHGGGIHKTVGKQESKFCYTTRKRSVSFKTNAVSSPCGKRHFPQAPTSISSVSILSPELQPHGDNGRCQDEYDRVVVEV